MFFMKQLLQKDQDFQQQQQTANHRNCSSMNVNAHKPKHKKIYQQKFSFIDGYDYDYDYNQGQDYQNTDQKQIKLQDILSENQLMLLSDKLSQNDKSKDNLSNNYMQKPKKKDYNNYDQIQIKRFWKTNQHQHLYEHQQQHNNKQSQQKNLNLNRPPQSYLNQYLEWKNKPVCSTELKLTLKAYPQPNGQYQQTVNCQVNCNVNVNASDAKSIDIKYDKQKNYNKMENAQNGKQGQSQKQKQKHYLNNYKNGQNKDRDYMRSHMRVIQNQYKSKMNQLIRENDQFQLDFQVDKKIQPQPNILKKRSEPEHINISSQMQTETETKDITKKLDSIIKSSQIQSQNLKSNQIQIQTQNFADGISFQHLISRPPNYNYNIIATQAQKRTVQQIQKNYGSTSKKTKSFDNKQQNKSFYSNNSSNDEQKIKSQLKQLYSNAVFPFADQRQQPIQQPQQKYALYKKKQPIQPKVRLNIEKLLKLSAKQFLIFYSQNYRKIINLCNPQQLKRLNQYRQKCLNKQNSIEKLQKMIAQKGETFIKKLSYQQKQKLFQVLYGESLQLQVQDQF